MAHRENQGALRGFTVRLGSAFAAACEVTNAKNGGRQRRRKMAAFISDMGRGGCGENGKYYLFFCNLFASVIIFK
jgi:hypothetical protein